MDLGVLDWRSPTRNWDAGVGRVDRDLGGDGVARLGGSQWGLGCWIAGVLAEFGVTGWRRSQQSLGPWSGAVGGEQYGQGFRHGVKI